MIPFIFCRIWGRLGLVLFSQDETGAGRSEKLDLRQSFENRLINNNFGNYFFSSSLAVTFFAGLIFHSWCSFFPKLIVAVLTGSADVAICWKQTFEEETVRILLVALMAFSFSSLARDFSESGSALDNRVMAGCQKYAEKQAQKHLDEHFNMNGWAGGNIGAGSVQTAQEQLPAHIGFLTSQCYNMVAEVLELKLGYGPWQN